MKQNDLLMIGAVAIGLMMYQRSARAGAKTPTSPKPAQTGASMTTMGQYWTSLLGPEVGNAVKNGTYKPNTAGESNASTYYQPVEGGSASNGDDSGVFWGIE